MNTVAFWRIVKSDTDDESVWKAYKEFTNAHASPKLRFAGLVLLSRHRFRLYRSFYLYCIRTRTQSPDKVRRFIADLETAQLYFLKKT